MVPSDFSRALQYLRDGCLVYRHGWNNSQYLEMWFPDPADRPKPGNRYRGTLAGEVPRMTLPYIYITTPEGDRVPWVPSQIDLLAEDWQENVSVMD